MIKMGIQKLDENESLPLDRSCVSGDNACCESGFPLKSRPASGEIGIPLDSISGCVLRYGYGRETVLYSSFSKR
jgi:hypothetical protein